MTDYTRSTGSTGTMMIRDTGSTIEFWINSNNGTTFNHQMPWAYNVNGSYSGWLSHNYNAGSGWNLLGSWSVTTSQTVTFYLGNTGTGGLGGPTTFAQAISRATVPAAPSTPSLSNITDDTVDVTFTDGANGGAAIDSRQIGYGIDPDTPQFTVSSDGSDTITVLTPGTTYYFWARTHNSVGYSAWSGKASAVTLRVPDPPSNPVLSNVTQVSVDLTWTANGNGGANITSYTIGYGTSPSAPTTTTTSATTSKTITGLLPGTTYYFWVKAQNSVGLGPYAGPSSTTTVAGVRVKDGGVWKQAIPYVKDGGVWKLARPFARIMGVWKPTN